MKDKYWYRTESHYCPVCGREETFKWREYSPKPMDWTSRNKIVEIYDQCIY